MSDRIDLLKELITPTRKRLAHKRLLEGESLVNSKTGEPLYSAADVKVALMLVHILNPYEALQKEEEAFMRGISSDTLRRRGNALRRL